MKPKSPGKVRTECVNEAFARFCAGDFEQAKRITWTRWKDRPDDALARGELPITMEKDVP